MKKFDLRTIKALIKCKSNSNADAVEEVVVTTPMGHEVCNQRDER